MVPPWNGGAWASHHFSLDPHPGGRGLINIPLVLLTAGNFSNMVSVNDIFNRPPTISEDTLQYTLYLPSGQSDRLSATTLATLLTDHVQSLLPEHLWHRDAFELKVAPDPEDNADIWVLEGRMRVGDCIDDEWCTVWLLKELSSKWDLVVRYITLYFLTVIDGAEGVLEAFSTLMGSSCSSRRRRSYLHG